MVLRIRATSTSAPRIQRHAAAVSGMEGRHHVISLVVVLLVLLAHPASASAKDVMFILANTTAPRSGAPRTFAQAMTICALEAAGRVARQRDGVTVRVLSTHPDEWRAQAEQVRMRRPEARA